MEQAEKRLMEPVFQSPDYDPNKTDFAEIGDITKRLFPKRAVRAYCTQCLGMKIYNREEVKNCPCYPYRMGRNPALVGKRKPNKTSFVRRNNKQAAINDAESTNPPQGESTYTGEVINAKITHRQHGTEGRM